MASAPVHPYSDYGVALRTLKSGRSWLSVLLFLCVVTQFIGFAFLYWTQQPYESMEPRLTPPATTVADKIVEHWQGTSTQQASPPPKEWFPRTRDGYNLNIRRQWDGTYLSLVPITQLLGLISVCSMTLLIYITLQVTLIAQAPGVAHITRSLIWMVLLLFMVFPWQYFFARDFPIPGIFYGYHELLNMIGPFVARNFTETIYPYQRFLVLCRFIFWPIFGMIVLIVSAERYRAGIMLAIGHPLQSMMQPRPAAGLAGKQGAAAAPMKR